VLDKRLENLHFASYPKDRVLERPFLENALSGAGLLRPTKVDYVRVAIFLDCNRDEKHRERASHPLDSYEFHPIVTHPPLRTSMPHS
jgi:hypothetical protein